MVLIPNNKGVLSRRKMSGMSMASEKVVFVACLVMFQVTHKQQDALTGLSTLNIVFAWEK